MYRRLFAIAAGVLLVGASPAAALNAAQPGIVSNIPAQGTPAVLDGVVNAVVQVGGQIVVGGQFEKRLVKLSLADGSIVPGFHAALMGSWVEDSDVRGNTLYIGGAISSVDGTARGRFAAVNATTGAIDPNVSLDFTDGRAGKL